MKKGNNNYNQTNFILEIKKRIKSIDPKKSERLVEDFFMSLFGDIPGFRASRAEAPRLKYHRTLYTDGIVSFNNAVFTIFEFKRGKIKFTEKKKILFNQEENVVYAQAIKYILCSNSKKFSSELKFNKVLIFNGYQIIKISINKRNVEKIYSKLKWNEELDSFLSDQRNLSSFLQNIILTKFNTIKPLINFDFILDVEKETNEQEIVDLYKEITSTTEAKISIIRMNLKEKFEEFSSFFDNNYIQQKARNLPYLAGLIIRIFIEMSVHINSGIHCIADKNKKIIRFKSEGNFFNVFYTEENEKGEMFDKPILIHSNYIKNVDQLNSFLKKHIINKLDVLYEDYDNLISDERTRKSIGLIFTKSNLAYLCYEFLTRKIPVDILRTCHIYDPAAGSGNLLKAQEDFITVIGSDIKKMNQDIMRNRNVNVPRSEIDFLQSSKRKIVKELNSVVEKYGRKFIDNPLLIIMNPPYRGKNTWVAEEQIGNKVGVSRDKTYLSDEFIKLLKSNKIRSTDLSSFFILKAMTFYLFDRYYGYIATFSPTNWLHPGRAEHDEFRKFILDNTKFIGGFIINGKDFFDNLKSNLTIAFSVFQLDKEKIKNPRNQKLLYYDLYKDHKIIKDLFDLREYKHWEPTYLNHSNKKKELKNLYTQLSNQVFNQVKLIDFSQHIKTKVYFKDIFRAINSQTGDDQKVLLHLEENFKKLDLNTLIPNIGIKNEEIYIVATDKSNGYDIAIKPKIKKNHGCVFSIPKTILGPTMAWHYLWDYLATYPTRFYNAVPITKKYAYTFIDPAPLISVNDVKRSRSCKTFSFIEKNLDTLNYIQEWQRKIGDIRGLFFFFFALTHSEIAAKIAKNVLHKNNPIWCPELNKQNIEAIKNIIQIGTAYAIYKFNKGFKEFTLSRKGTKVIETINYFDINSKWFLKSKIKECLLNINKKNLPVVKKIVYSKIPEGKIKGMINNELKKIDSYN